MKLCLATLLIIFLSIEAHGSRVKRGLNADEQKKFLDVLNKDRKKIADEVGFQFVPMKYDASLEKEIVSGKKCLENRVLPLRYNDVAEQYRERTIGMGKLSGADGDIYQYYFRLEFDKIGCSKEAKCTDVLTKEHDIQFNLVGKTIEYHGLCKLRSSDGKPNPDPDSKKLKKAETPSPNKYGDILGIPAISGTGSVFSLTISLFLVLYI